MMPIVLAVLDPSRHARHGTALCTPTVFGLSERSRTDIGSRRRIEPVAAPCRSHDHPLLSGCFDRYLFVLDGVVLVVIYALDGKALLFTDLEKGEVFGEIAAIDRGPRSASIETLKPTLVAVMSATHFERMLRDDPEVSLATMRFLTTDLRGDIGVCFRAQRANQPSRPI